METSHSLAHHERLRSLGQIRRLFESGKSGFVYPLRYMWYSEEQQTKNRGGEGSCEQSIQLLFTVPKRFHKRANKRNTLRRRVKESYRLQKHTLQHTEHQPNNNPASIDIALVYSTKEFHSYKTIDHAVRKILENIAKEL